MALESGSFLFITDFRKQSLQLCFSSMTALIIEEEDGGYSIAGIDSPIVVSVFLTQFQIDRNIRSSRKGI
jgi:hypothetical protein